MRLVLSLAAFLLLLPRDATARPIWVEFGFLNSELTFGFVNPDHSGYDLYGLSVGTKDYFGSLTVGTFQAGSGPLVEQTLVTNGSGTVIASNYLYERGTFLAEFGGVESSSGDLVAGSLITSITSLEIFASEGVEAAGFAIYGLGPGLVDAALANALGIPQRIQGGWIYSFLLNRPGTGGDYTSPERQAWDGGTNVSISVPEPPLLLLGILSLSVAWLGRRGTSRTQD